MPLYTPTITLAPSGKQFDSVPGRSILDAGLSSGLALPFGCANGSCGDCKATVLSGDVTRVKFHDYSLTEAEKLANVCLICSNAAVSNVTLEVSEISSVRDIPTQALRAKRCRVENLDSVDVVGFKFVRGRAFQFLPGQSARVTFPAGESIDLPIASCPCNSQFVEFHLPSPGFGRYAQAGLLSAALTSLERVTVTGPVGQFTLSAEIHKPKLFVAIGEGFASIQGLIEHVFNLETETPCTLVWFATDSVGHYRHNLCRSWADAMDEFTYYPIAVDDVGPAALEPIMNRMKVGTEIYLSSEEAAQSLPNRRFIDLLSCLTMSGASISMI